MTSKTTARKCQDMNWQVLTYSEIKALCSSNERIKEKLMLDNDVKGLHMLSAEHQNTVFEMEDKIKVFPEKEKNLLTAIDNLHSSREHIRKLPIDEKTKLSVFRITIGETEYTDRKEMAKALETAVLSVR